MKPDFRDRASYDRSDNNSRRRSGFRDQYLYAFLFRRFMLATKPDGEHHVPNIFKAIKIAQSPEFQEALKETEEHETISQDEK